MKIKGFQDTINWYDQNAAQYAQAIAKRARLEFLGQFSQLLPPCGRVLDAGCAAGRDVKILTDKGFKVVGLDLAKGLLKLARQQCPDLEFIEADLRKMPFADNSFDGLWAHASLVHLESFNEVKKALKEFKRVLTPGGIIHFDVKVQVGDKKFKVVKDKLSQHERFFQFFSRDEIISLLKELTFEIIELKQYQETEVLKDGRPGVKWLVCFARNNKAIKKENK